MSAGLQRSERKASEVACTPSSSHTNSNNNINNIMHRDLMLETFSGEINRKKGRKGLII